MTPEAQARYDLEMQRLKVQEMETEAKLHPAPVTVVWGDPIMEECAR